MSSLWQTVSENVVFVLEFLALIVVMFLIAYVIEKAVKKKNNDTERVLATRKIVVIGVFSAIAAILMVLEFPVPFAPSFYGLYCRLRSFRLLPLQKDHRIMPR